MIFNQIYIKMKLTLNIFDFGKKENSRALKTVKQLYKKYQNVELGRNRIVFLSKFCVIKFPTCSAGVIDNDWETSISGETLAQTKPIYINGFLCCMMIKVTPTYKNYNELPDWVGSVDCGQVGYSKKGKLLAFDYGYC